MKNLMLAGLDAQTVTQLRNALNKPYRIHHCTCGSEVLSDFSALLPELLVVDLTMPGCDTVGLLRAVQARGSQTQALVTTCAYHEQIESQLSMVDTAFLLIQPFDGTTIVERLMQLEQLLPELSVSDRADEILRDLGLDCNSIGFPYLQTAISYKYAHPQCLYTADLCVHVAKCHGTTAASADKAMIRCIQKARRRMDPVLWSVYLGDGAASITCAQFIAAVARYIASVE